MPDRLQKLDRIGNHHLPVLRVAHGRARCVFDTANVRWLNTAGRAYDGVGIGDLEAEDFAALGTVTAKFPLLDDRLVRRGVEQGFQS